MSQDAGAKKPGTMLARDPTTKAKCDDDEHKGKCKWDAAAGKCNDKDGNWQMRNHLDLATRKQMTKAMKYMQSIEGCLDASVAMIDAIGSIKAIMQRPIGPVGKFCAVWSLPATQKMLKAIEAAARPAQTDALFLAARTLSATGQSRVTLSLR